MAIFTPHESQADVYLGYGGRAADYAGASTFVTPGQAALPGALNQLAAGVDKLGGTVNALALERQNRRNLADMLADQLAEKDAFRAFDADYRQTHKGAAAREAEAAYESYFEERREGLRRKWEGNQRLMLAAEQMFAPIRQSGLDGAYAYSLREEEDYAKRKLAAAETGLLGEAADPDRAYQDKLSSLADFENSMRGMAGGRNVDPELAAVRRNFALEHLQSLLLGGNTDEAETYVNGNKDMFGEEANDALAKIADRRRSLAAQREAAAKEARGAYKNRLLGELPGMDPLEAQSRILNDPDLADEEKKDLFDVYESRLRLREKLDKNVADKKTAAVRKEMRALRDRGATNLDEYTALIAALPPDRQAELEDYAGRLVEGDPAETDAAAFLQAASRAGQGDFYFLPAVEYAGRLSLADQEILENPARLQTLARTLPRFAQKAEFYGLTPEELAPAFAGFARDFVPEEGFRNARDFEEALDRSLMYVTMSKIGLEGKTEVGPDFGSWGSMGDTGYVSGRTVRGHEAGALAREGYYPGAGPESEAFRLSLEAQGIHLEKLTGQERSKAYRAFRGIR